MCIYIKYCRPVIQQIFDNYSCSLRELAKTCELGDIADKMIHDRIVLRTNDQREYKIETDTFNTNREKLINP